MFAALGLVKIEKKFVPARAAQKGVPNPFKPGELMDRPAKPASSRYAPEWKLLHRPMTEGYPPARPILSVNCQE